MNVEAIRALQVASEGVLIGMMSDAARCALHAKRVQIDPRGTELYVEEADDPSLHCQWFRRPPSGALGGRVFTDGSAVYGFSDTLRRAGWAVVHVDDDGNCLSFGK